MGKNGGFNWVMGCSIGCAGLIVLAILGGVGLYFLASEGMEAGKIAIAEELQGDFDARLTDGNIPDDQLGLMTELVDLATDEDTSFPMLLMCSAAYEVGVETQSDMTDEERYTMVQVVVDFVSEDPGAGFIKMGTFIDQNPEYGDIFENLQDQSFRFDDDDNTRELSNDEVSPATESGQPVAEPVQ